MKTFVHISNKILMVALYYLLFFIGARSIVLLLLRMKKWIVSLAQAQAISISTVYIFLASIYILIGLVGFLFIAKFWKISNNIRILGERNFIDRNSLWSYAGMFILGLFGGIIFLAAITLGYLR